MLISDSHNFIFVHIRKTGGSSLRQVLSPYSNTVPHSRLSKLGTYLKLVRDYRRYPFGLHASLARCQQIMPADRFESAFKFGFVRNPWDRLASEYRFILSRPEHRRYRRVAAMQSFEAFVRYQIQREKGSQLEMLKAADGEIGADFVGRFENLAEDFAHVCRQIEIPEPTQLVHINKGPPGDFRDLYDDDSADLVEKHWSAEIQAFGYAFERC